MDLTDTGAVVTGAGNGIGAAIARRLAGAGARVVVNDLDAGAAEAVAAEIGGVAVPGDAAGEAGVTALVAEAGAHLGGIDLYVANAGVGVGGGPEAPESDWDLAWQVNVMAHVRAARELVPGWLERGRGRFLTTVSAAGLLTMLGSAPYSVTKHAALAFGEWMSATYGDRGITVQCVCPMGVRTNLLESSGDTGRAILSPEAITPEEVADAVMVGLADGRFLILPHPQVADHYAARADDTDRWLAGMRRLQARVFEERA
ncbi:MULTISPECIES: SDR family oxidoreductase [Nocardiopsis]|uniref:Short-chain dehydrogenase/reductase SDR n=1 Tax=Nocardiopsis dassonvillei (strain ATCC 23218 / DSM 43111 / CIP 107115 / JCM 7437 / KCTC 9190 / NBRC 14626 / NCTC 10488 / NRRL B-5397 / IMRU 509) TaxID=446468 RepID=D7B0U4_NOCDD|nr:MULTISPECIES: SDR family oxidoreductase [Nocardiopsis]ADH68329.1 short-chain dehydrogenase/reductase SDR [Nocardiopsis dassonvillei subsp. dassonvillei DSM 43111]APC36431.1 dehydrogenase [Nocardiopsis dassonvillei]NKY81550.1 SDR family oxidoreductase [Nocardiopsis dassonvillei]VEI88833.1 D-beta-hydroxybutyrate dehydrogenase [Nocardiopsis dassonvillei]